MSVSIFDNEGLEQVRRELRLEPKYLRRFRNAYCKQFAGIERALDEIPPACRDAFADRVRAAELQLESRFDSEQDGATKLLLRTAGGHLIESVILRTTTGRVALCLSCQVGCAAACDFCATGKMGIAHNLSASEMLAQLAIAGELIKQEQRRIRNLVFMGMGEPFHNEEQLYATIDRLVGGDYFHHSPNRILVSTVGLPDAMVRFARRYPRVNLAVSLHSARQTVRESIIPLARRYRLPELRRALESINRIQTQPIMIEYLMLAGVNDSPADAAALAEYVAGLNVHINLIPYNAIDDAPHLRGTDREGRDAFAGQLRGTGLIVTIRYSLGGDIAAACGQLVRQENRRSRAGNA